MATAMGRLRARVKVIIKPGAIHVEPDRLEVTAGTIVEWHFESQVRDEGVDVTIHFRNKSPFPWNEEKRRLPKQQPTGVVAAPAEDPGDYKYGVRARGDSTQQAVGDVDPWLIVRA
jgi:hypothetical protein